MIRLSQKTHLSFILALSMALLIGCSATPVKKQLNDLANPDTQEFVTGDDIAGVSAEPSPVSDLMFNLLAGEFSGVRGEMAQSVDYYERAAEQSQDADIITRAAYIALYAGKHQLAIELTDRWLALALPSSDAINRIRVIAYLHLEQLNFSVDALSGVMMDNGELKSDIASPITRILSHEASPQFAKQVVEQLDKKYPNQAFILLLLAKFEAQLGELRPALIHVNQLIKLDGELIDAYLIKAQIYVGLNKQALAVKSVAVAVSKKPDDTRLRLQYGRMLVQMKSFDAALANFKILNKAMPHNENVLLSLGLLSIEVNDNQQAKEYLQELLDSGYHNQQAHYYLGRIQQNNGEVMAAIANFERVKSGEYWLDAKLRAAGLFAKTGDVDAALFKLESLNKKHATDNTRIKVYLAKGDVLRSINRNKEAYHLYNTALQMSPENTSLLYARALTAEKLDMLDVTESDLKMVIMHEPDNASALNALGYTLADRTTRLNEAQGYILKAAQLLPEDPAILDSLGWVYYRLGEFEDAIKWLSKAFEQLEDAEIAAHLGEALWMHGKTQEAKNIWHKGSKLNGNQTVLKDTVDRLKK